MDFRHPHFAEPAWLWLAVFAPLALLLLNRRAASQRKKQIALFAAPELVANLIRSHSPLRRALKNLMLLLCVTVIALGLARPQWGETTEISRALGEDIMFILDCSKSMLATDVRPNRLGRARFAILDFVQRHGRGRVGLVAFSGEAFLQCPLTFDYDAFRESLLNEQGAADYVRDSSGNVVKSELDETTLTAIAQATHGAYHPLGALGEGLNSVRHLVENSTSSTDFSKLRKLGVDRFHVPVAAAIILLVVESLVGTRRNLRQNSN
jgi:hypothetical protein